MPEPWRLLAAPADAQDGHAKKKKTVTYNRDRTVQVSRDEDGRTRTRIIIQKRSYLDPGTETFPGERGDHDYAENAEPARRRRDRQYVCWALQYAIRASGTVDLAVQEQSLAGILNRPANAFE